MNKVTQRVLGIDPGSRITGYGVIDIQNGKSSYVDSGCIKISSDAIPARLKTIFADLSELISHFQPDQVAIESVFMHKNADSALKLGQARGAAICAAVHNDLEVAEYSARKIKQAVVGNGNAAKEQVQMMVRMLLQINHDLQADAADALAIALCHAHTGQTMANLPQAVNFRRGRLR